ncbi:MAG: bifunctional diaminohydroxyphosphoribosylaminopyrimidine deaminase/5-amino-6-(5-phosphoribosylamino)uracil reductase RibD [Gammaproteobacteria bacterium]|jgi:diaminohydroxyphosphoribosylaminopyrimidine deaminase/5-amino-6-(5-phosphoribosylamino)uracil reductase|nr:bifunctional diaminohydroxyphosphoribosylaminopyrimidine deaminase/5-amino-6-(5-phosphoribosylamino)uracil reductase RibD [Gammaproteobacteria bacterium]
MSLEDQGFMAKALRLAENGRYSAHPNPCVGCVLVRRGNVVGEGFHMLAGQGHAEANALASAGIDALGSIAYVTLEPCSFHGRTPSCAHALVDAGVTKVVVAMLDPDERNAGKGIQILREAGLEVVVPFMEDAAQELLKGHVSRHTKHRPFVRLKLAMTLDGKTALSNGESRWITSPESRADVQKLRAASGAIVTGVQTVIDDDPRLSIRSEELHVEHAQLCAGVERPVYILDSGLRIPETVQLMSVPSTVVVTTSDREANLPVEVLRLSALENRVDISALLQELAAREHSEVLFECGPTLAGSLINQRLADEIVIYIAPRLIGNSGRSLLNLAEVARMSDLAELSIKNIRVIGPDIKVTASVN